MLHHGTRKQKEMCLRMIVKKDKENPKEIKEEKVQLEVQLLRLFFFLAFCEEIKKMFSG